MTAGDRYLTASEAARRLGVSGKALRLYEDRGLVAPLRTEAGWRAYGPEAMARAAEVAALRRLGFSLAQVARVLGGETEGLEPALAAQQARLEGEAGRLHATIEQVRGVRAELAAGKPPAVRDLTRLAEPSGEPLAAFDLPWPWGGERFELRAACALTYITGPLGSGKSRLAAALAAALPQGAFAGLDRLADEAAAAKAALAKDAALRARVEAVLAWLADDGAAMSDALLALLVALEGGSGPLVADVVEEGLEEATQMALMAHLRRRGAQARRLFLLTRSSAILDLSALGADECVLYCPANHSPPMHVAAHPGAPGYEAVATCLATPQVRARSAGVIAWRPTTG